jgi:hypothetical protein
MKGYTMKKFTTEIDVSYETPVSEVAEFAHEHGCYVASVVEIGPAGGNPCYTIASESYKSIKSLIEEYFGGSGFDEEELANFIVEV